MFAGLEESQLGAAIEAILFVTDRPVSTQDIADRLEIEKAQAKEACLALQEKLQADERGIQLVEAGGGWRLCTHPAYHELLEGYVLSWDTRRLSQAALEVLSIVAYAQPVTRNGIAEIRGVNSDSSLNSLIEKGLIREMGSSDAPGNPMLYGTTTDFLEKFGLANIKSLPDLAEFAPDDETRDFIRERLSAVHRIADEVVEASEVPEADITAEDEKHQEAMYALLGEVIAQSTDVVEKIDFDDLEFEDIATEAAEEAAEDSDTDLTDVAE